MVHCLLESPRLLVRSVSQVVTVLRLLSEQLYSPLTSMETYLVSMPIDPSDDGTDDGTGYTIVEASGRVTVAAPGAEQSATISVTR